MAILIQTFAIKILDVHIGHSVELYPQAHHAGWIVCGHENSFWPLRSCPVANHSGLLCTEQMCTNYQTIHKFASTYLVATKWVADLHSLLVTTYFSYPLVYDLLTHFNR